MIMIHQRLLLLRIYRWDCSHRLLLAEQDNLHLFPNVRLHLFLEAGITDTSPGAFKLLFEVVCLRETVMELFISHRL